MYKKFAFGEEKGQKLSKAEPHFIDHCQLQVVDQATMSKVAINAPPLCSSPVANPIPASPTQTHSVDSEEVILDADAICLVDFYHGMLPRKDIQPLLQKPGDFLVRKTDGEGCVVLVVSVRAPERVLHFVVNRNPTKNLYYFENHGEKSIKELIEWHITTGTPLSSDSGAKIKRPIERSPWILNHDALKMRKKLGEGAFGEVFLADYVTEKSEMKVAVKTMRNEVKRIDRLQFMKEARIMRKLQHKNVVRIVGLAVDENPILLVMEVCPGGALLSYLRRHKETITQEAKLRFSTEGAAGLDYLVSQGLIHRDIAARNCLLTSTQELKISDFGMSSEKKQIQDKKLDKVPIKWLAPETMQERIYNTKTDVWSYGVMLWEIYTHGKEPYPGMSNMQTRAKIIVQNYRMEIPKDTPAEVGKVIAECWARLPNDRPNFAKIFETLSAVKLA
uniref:Tyrosine-protein kinase n=1 Tax=Steinernema glaseri TaxID=37863 RepID=A0A1I8AM95_9BILA